MHLYVAVILVYGVSGKLGKLLHKSKVVDV